jgi:hypothetical protein
MAEKINLIHPEQVLGDLDARIEEVRRLVTSVAGQGSPQIPLPATPSLDGNESGSERSAARMLPPPRHPSRKASRPPMGPSGALPPTPADTPEMTGLSDSSTLMSSSPSSSSASYMRSGPVRSRSGSNSTAYSAVDSRLSALSGASYGSNRPLTPRSSALRALERGPSRQRPSDTPTPVEVPRTRSPHYSSVTGSVLAEEELQHKEQRSAVSSLSDGLGISNRYTSSSSATTASSSRDLNASQRNSMSTMVPLPEAALPFEAHDEYREREGRRIEYNGNKHGDNNSRLERGMSGMTLSSSYPQGGESSISTRSVGGSPMIIPGSPSNMHRSPTSASQQYQFERAAFKNSAMLCEV